MNAEPRYPSCRGLRSNSLLSNGNTAVDGLPVRVIEKAAEPEQTHDDPWIVRVRAQPRSQRIVSHVAPSILVAGLDPGLVEPRVLDRAPRPGPAFRVRDVDRPVGRLDDRRIVKLALARFSCARRAASTSSSPLHHRRARPPASAAPWADHCRSGPSDRSASRIASIPAPGLGNGESATGDHETPSSLD